MDEIDRIELTKEESRMLRSMPVTTPFPPKRRPSDVPTGSPEGIAKQPSSAENLAPIVEYCFNCRRVTKVLKHSMATSIEWLCTDCGLVVDWEVDDDDWLQVKAVAVDTNEERTNGPRQAQYTGETIRADMDQKTRDIVIRTIAICQIEVEKSIGSTINMVDGGSPWGRSFFEANRLFSDSDSADPAEPRPYDECL